MEMYCGEKSYGATYSLVLVMHVVGGLPTLCIRTSKGEYFRFWAYECGYHIDDTIIIVTTL